MEAGASLPAVVVAELVSYVMETGGDFQGGVVVVAVLVVVLVVPVVVVQVVPSFTLLITVILPTY